MAPDAVRAYYAGFGEREWARLENPDDGVVEFAQRALVELAESDPTTYEAAFEVVLNTASDPSILGMATHLLYVGKKTE